MKEYERWECNECGAPCCTMVEHNVHTEDMSTDEQEKRMGFMAACPMQRKEPKWRMLRWVREDQMTAVRLTQSQKLAQQIVDAMPRELWSGIAKIICEYCRASKMYPAWPQDAVHAAAVLAEEAGEVVQAALDFNYKADGPSALQVHREKIEEEAVQAGAMALRVLQGLAGYRQCHKEATP